MRTMVREVADTLSVSAEVRDDLVLAVSEACANSIRHTESPSITVSTRVVDHEVVITIADEGIFHWGLGRLGSDAGFGIALMQSLTDRMSIEEGSPEAPGTKVVLVRRISS